MERKISSIFPWFLQPANVVYLPPDDGNQTERHQCPPCVCVVRHSSAWLPLFKARFHFIESFGAPVDQYSPLTCPRGTQIWLTVPRGSPLEVMILRALDTYLDAESV